MSRQPCRKPWLHQSSGFWCVTLQGQRHYLDKNYQTACRKLWQLRADEQQQQVGGKQWLDAPSADLVSEYLDDLKERRKPATYKANRYRLLRALKIIGTDVTVGQLKKYHLGKIERSMQANYSLTSIADTLTTVSGFFYWAIKYDLLESNPLRGYHKPARRSTPSTDNDQSLRHLGRFAAVTRCHRSPYGQVNSVCDRMD